MVKETKETKETNEQPEIYCALSLVFDKNEEIDCIIRKIVNLGIDEIKITKPRFEEIVCIDIAIVKYVKSWYLDEVLTKMFLHTNKYLKELKQIVEYHNGKIIVDIAFCHYGTFPALEFVGENMKKICFLEAEISIDCY